MKDEGAGGAERNIELPPVKDGELAQVLDVRLLTSRTKPPPRYTEGTLLGDMEGAAKFIENEPELRKVLKGLSGLGTAATRDSIIETLKAHSYLVKSGKFLEPTDKGTRFIQWLCQHMPELTDVAMTARWEAELAVVAKEGNGARFERDAAEKIKTLVSIFRAAAPMQVMEAETNPSSTEKKRMSENQGRQPGRPTDPMLNYAKKIAQRLGIRMPDNVMSDFDACSSFIDANKDAANKPTDKQLSLANRIAESKGLTIPEEVLANGRELSGWIDENK